MEIPKLNKENESKLFNFLGINSYKDVLSLDYSSEITPENDMDHESVRRYARNFRGFTRLGSDLFYTAKEHEERIKNKGSLTIP